MAENPSISDYKSRNLSRRAALTDSFASKEIIVSFATALNDDH